jgi:hypothetical protein
MKRFVHLRIPVRVEVDDSLPFEKSILSYEPNNLADLVEDALDEFYERQAINVKFGTQWECAGGSIENGRHIKVLYHVITKESIQVEVKRAENGELTLTRI